MTFDRATGARLAARLFRPGSAEALALLRAAWPRVVGPELSRRTELQAVEGITLRVRVPDAGWRKVLHRMQGDILARLREVAGEVAPRRLAFVEGPVSAAASPEAPREASPRAPAACPPAVAAGAAAIADPEIRARFLESAARYLGRAPRHLD